ncbi:triose-phosphate isomerase [Candidatus Falkowbacteria bacterium RBG_13_39_14]|uniref:Triosephosphate isomerase n=1 Tax=Candidatus Falkowbacteria bacterium RBG_13_39_14 TaxID=1797985 RepID=A0A1F5S6U3_9BACT|nr:MAG: triose-phosphate isomerase [Candidatus Falkowbacteria bacterium RBG_13_39_14]
MKPILIANWKMKLGLKESLDLTEKIKKGLIKKESKIHDRFIGVQDRWTKKLDVVLCPPFTALSDVRKKIANTGISLGAQDVFWEEKGAYTGEISAMQLKEVGVKYVIIGHSERRQNLNETDEMIHKKMRLALEAGLIPVLCIGETYEERKDGQKDYVIARELIKALQGIKVNDRQKIIISYEPVWVIGTGQAVESDEAELSAKFIKNSLLDLFSKEFIDNNAAIVYGGSVSSRDAKNFFDQPAIDGALVGAASLDAKEFLAIINKILDL